jgi:hypothetical protein
MLIALVRRPLLVRASCCLTLALSIHAQQAFDCGFRSHSDWVAGIESAIARGEIAARPAAGSLAIPRSTPQALGAGAPCIDNAQIYQYEDTNQLLMTNFSTGELLDLMTTAANELIATHGDNYDFIGYWVNSPPDHKIGAAFYAGIFSDTLGIGLTPYDERASFGLLTNRVQGYIQMWNVNNSHWEAGTGPGADFTRLALAQEFEHRFAMFLPDLNDGRMLQGDNSGCGRGAHWSWRVDGQGSGMEIADWIGSNPAQLAANFVSFNTDIPGGVFSYSDLYLMGYVTPAEMDAGNSELRFMDGSDCSSDHFAVSNFDSSDIIASAGARVPDAAGSQKDFRTAWIMIYQPGDEPSVAELDKTTAILEQHQIDWEYGTLGRGTINDTLFDDCNCNGLDDAAEIAGGKPDFDGDGVLDECQAIGSNYCVATLNSSGQSAAILALGSDEVALNDLTLVAYNMPPGEFGYFITSETQGFVPGAGGSQGNLCVLGTIGRFNALIQMSDAQGIFGITVDLNAIPLLGVVMAGETWSFQTWFRDNNPGSTSNFSDGLELMFQ